MPKNNHKVQRLVRHSFNDGGSFKEVGKVKVTRTRGGILIKDWKK